MEKQLKIEVGKFYKLRNGRKAVVSKINKGGDFPVYGTIFWSEAESDYSWTINGRYSKHHLSHLDIVSEWEDEAVNHPSHYGGEDNPYETIKVIEAWQLNFNLGNVIKYISRAGKKGSKTEDLQKALWYLQREITNNEK
jgi:hypothetical protein